MAEAQRRSNEAELRSIEETKNGDDEDERQSSAETRPEKRAKTTPDSTERFQDLEKGVVNPENRSVDAQDSLHEQIDQSQRKEAHDNLQQQSNDETEAHDQQNMAQQRDIERNGREIRYRLDLFYQRQQELNQKKQQESPPPQQQRQSLVSHFHLYPLVEKLTDAIEAGTRDQHSDALVTELSSYFNKSQQLLNSISGSLGSKSMTVDGQKRKLEESEKLLQQRRELIVEYRKSVEDIFKTEP